MNSSRNSGIVGAKGGPISYDDLAQSSLKIIFMESLVKDCWRSKREPAFWVKHWLQNSTNFTSHLWVRIQSSSTYFSFWCLNYLTATSKRGIDRLITLAVLYHTECSHSSRYHVWGTKRRSSKLCSQALSWKWKNDSQHCKPMCYFEELVLMNCKLCVSSFCSASATSRVLRLPALHYGTL